MTIMMENNEWEFLTWNTEVPTSWWGIYEVRSTDIFNQGISPYETEKESESRVFFGEHLQKNGGKLPNNNYTLFHYPKAKKVGLDFTEFQKKTIQPQIVQTTHWILAVVKCHILTISSRFDLVMGVAETEPTVQDCACFD